jgi:tetratricopeptide (TPR) repeat protein
MFIRLAFLFALVLFSSACHAKDPPSLAQIAEAVDDGQGDSVEPTLLAMHKADPSNAEVLAQLTRIEYLRALGGNAQPSNGLDMRFDPTHMAAAERWAKLAVAANPEHANAWIAYSQILIAREQLKESLEMLARAEALDPSSVKLRLRKGAALRALAAYSGDDSKLAEAAREYQLAIKGRVDDGNEATAAMAVAGIYADQREFAKSIDFLTRAIDASEGSTLAFALERRARTHLNAGNVDASLADSREALEVMSFGVAVSTLVDGMLVKAGLAMRDEGEAAAQPFVEPLARSGMSPVQNMQDLASRPTTFPALYALLSPPWQDAGGREAAAHFVGESAHFVTAADLRKLHALGMSFDSVDEMGGTLLHRAIAHNNVDAVRELLVLGADASIPQPSGITSLQEAATGTSPERKEIRRLLLEKLGTPEGWKELEVDLPVAGKWYRADRLIGIGQDLGRRPFEAGMTLLAGGRCKTPDGPYFCFVFYTEPQEYYSTVLVPFDRLEDLKELHEVPAPE